MSAIERFDIERVSEILEASLHNGDDVLVNNYLLAFQEINKFFQLMGSVFSFVSTDIGSKITILQEFHQSPSNGHKFVTLKSMMSYEKDEGLLQNRRYVSASRTLLRLHRGLEFVLHFLTELSQLREGDQTYNCCKKAYNNTLAQHHPWVIRKAALVAMYTLPTQGELLKRVCTNPVGATAVLPRMLENTKHVYDRTHNLYTLFDLHDLP